MWYKKICKNCGLVTKRLINGKDIEKKLETWKFCSYKCKNTLKETFSERKNRFESMFKKGNEKDCWLWLGRTYPDNYGIFHIPIKESNDKLAHRWSYRIYKGEIPNNLWILHKCDTPNCVNPEHLYAGTPKENSRDAKIRNRYNQWKGEENKNHKVSNLDVLNIRKLYESGISQPKLAIKYKLTQSSISRIINKKRWGHLESPSD